MPEEDQDQGEDGDEDQDEDEDEESPEPKPRTSDSLPAPVQLPPALRLVRAAAASDPSRCLFIRGVDKGSADEAVADKIALLAGIRKSKGSKKESDSTGAGSGSSDLVMFAQER